MKLSKTLVVPVGVALVVGAAFLARESREEVTSTRPGPDQGPALPTFVELGSDQCTSCRAMIPVLEELRETHPCGLSVRFVDVWARPSEAERYAVSTIPTQVLFAPDGRELRRHTGFWSADAIRAAFAAAGFPLIQDEERCAP